MTTASIPPQAEDVVLASVNSVQIHSDVFGKWLNFTLANGGQDSPQLRQNLLNDLILREAVAQDIASLGLLQNEHNQFKLELAKQNAALELWFAHFFNLHPISEADIRSEYEKQLAMSNDPLHSTEYFVSQIVVSTEAEALKLIKQIQNPTSFEVLAKECSLDRASGDRGGQLGWAFANQFAPPMNEIIPTLTVGKIHPKPIQMPVGFYIVQLTNSRRVALPPFEQAKDNILKLLIARGRQQAIAELMNRSKVDMAK